MDGKVAYFAGCTANYLEPGIGKAVVDVLQKNGLQMVLPEQKCCSLAKLAYGDTKGFINNARFNIHHLARADCDIVTACSSCGLTLRREYPKMLKEPEAEIVARRTYDILEYLAILKARNKLNSALRPVGLSVLYHTPCHLRVFGKDFIESRMELMRSIPGLAIARLDRGCCGMGGTFGMKKSTYAVSMAVGRALFEEIDRLSPDMVATDCPGCKMQIEGGTGKKVVHPIILIKQAYGI